MPSDPHVSGEATTDAGGTPPARILIAEDGRHSAPAGSRANIEFTGDGRGTLVLPPDGPDAGDIFPFTVFGLGVGDRIAFRANALFFNKNDLAYSDNGDGTGLLRSNLLVDADWNQLKLRLSGEYSPGQFRLVPTGEDADGLIGIAFERVASEDGTSGADLLLADSGGERVIGLGGDDVLVSGDGDDVLDGGAGSDTADYRAASGGVSVALAFSDIAQAVGGGQGSDRLLSIENVNGSRFADELKGDDGNNRLDGGAGADTLHPGLGGADTLIGGDGADIFVLEADFKDEGAITIADFVIGSDRIGTIGVAPIRLLADVEALVADKTDTNDAVLFFEVEGFSGTVRRTVTLVGVDWRDLSASDFTRLDNSAPILFAEDVSVDENRDAGLAVLSATAEDRDGDPLTFSVEGGDAAFFTVDGEGAVRFKASPDFEAKADKDGDGVYAIRLVVSDGALRDEREVTVTLRDVNDAPAIAGGASATVSVRENISPDAVAHKVLASDQDAGSRLAYALVDGGDAARFTLDASGNLRFKAAPDFEKPADSGQDGTYDLVVRVSDGEGGVVQQAIAIEIADANEPPAFTTGNAFSIAENTPSGVKLVAGDPDKGDSLGFAIVGGADAGFFKLDPKTGVLAFAEAADFEARADADGNNVYEVVARVSDGKGGTADQAIAVRVLDADEAPVVVQPLRNQTVAEDAACRFVLPAETFADPEGRSLSLSASLGDGAALPSWLAFDAAERAFSGTPPANWNGSLHLAVSASDGSAATTSTFTLTVTPANDAPVIASNGGKASAAVSVAENKATVASFKADDVDGDALAWSLTGKDAKLFTMSKTGQLAFKTAPDFESPKDGGRNNVYDVVVKVGDGSASDTQALAVKVLNAKGKSLAGTTKANTLVGTGEEDRLAGKAGKDLLKGLGGPDSFVFDTKLDAKSNVDRIVDFSGEDRIELSRSVFAGLKAGKLDADLFKDLSKKGAKADASDHLLYSKATGQLFFDADGAGTEHGRVLFAEVANKAALDAGDFWVI